MISKTVSPTHLLPDFGHYLAARHHHDCMNHCNCFVRSSIMKRDFTEGVSSSTIPKKKSRTCSPFEVISDNDNGVIPVAASEEQIPIQAMLSSLMICSYSEEHDSMAMSLPERDESSEEPNEKSGQQQQQQMIKVVNSAEASDVAMDVFRKRALLYEQKSRTLVRRTALQRRLVREKIAAENDEAMALVDEYLRCLAIKANTIDSNAKLVSMPHRIESVWRSHLLNTSEYAALCNEVFAGVFIHHDPEQDNDDQLVLRHRLQRMRCVYESCFGQTLHPSLWEDPALSTHNISSLASSSSIGLAARQAGQQQRDGFVCVMTLQRKELKIPFIVGETIATLKDRVENIEGTPAHEQCLIFSGRKLEDSQTLAECNVGPGSTLHNILRIYRH